jgi:hypothetical protein
MKKSHAQKVAAAEDRKVLRRRILKALEQGGYNTKPGYIPALNDATNHRVAALLRELLETR